MGGGDSRLRSGIYMYLAGEQRRLGLPFPPLDSDKQPTIGGQNSLSPLNVTQHGHLLCGSLVCFGGRGGEWGEVLRSNLREGNRLFSQTGPLTLILTSTVERSDARRRVAAHSPAARGGGTWAEDL